MPRTAYKSVTIQNDTQAKAEKIRAKRGKRSVAQVVSELIDKEYKRLFKQ